jgi:hypothetical protein
MAGFDPDALLDSIGIPQAPSFDPDSLLDSIGVPPGPKRRRPATLAALDDDGPNSSPPMDRPGDLDIFPPSTEGAKIPWPRRDLSLLGASLRAAGAQPATTPAPEHSPLYNLLGLDVMKDTLAGAGRTAVSTVKAIPEELNRGTSGVESSMGTLARASGEALERAAAKPVFAGPHLPGAQQGLLAPLYHGPGGLLKSLGGELEDIGGRQSEQAEANLKGNPEADSIVSRAVQGVPMLTGLAMTGGASGATAGMGLLGAGAGLREAERAGATPGQAWGAAALQGGADAALGQIGSIPAIRGLLHGVPVEGAADAVLGLLKQGGQGALQAVGMDVAHGLARKLTYAKDMGLDPSELAKNAAAQALLQGAMEAPGIEMGGHRAEAPAPGETSTAEPAGAPALPSAGVQPFRGTWPEFLASRDMDRADFAVQTPGEKRTLRAEYDAAQDAHREQAAAAREAALPPKVGILDEQELRGFDLSTPETAELSAPLRAADLPNWETPVHPAIEAAVDHAIGSPRITTDIQGSPEIAARPASTFPAEVFGRLVEGKPLRLAKTDLERDVGQAAKGLWPTGLLKGPADVALLHDTLAGGGDLDAAVAALARTAPQKAQRFEPPPPPPVQRSPGIATDLQGSPGISGTAVTDAGTELPFRYALASTPDLVTSHLRLGDGSLQPNPDFPAELQPRDRSRAASVLQVSRMAAGLDPERLAESRLASQGAPLVGPDGAVESGNARVLAIGAAYANGPQAAAYRLWLASNAARFGLDPAAVRSLDQPVLVRQRLEVPGLDRVRLAQEANQSDVATMSRSERAAVDARAFTPELLDQYTPNGAGDLASPSNRGFALGFLQKTSSPAELGALVDPRGQLSQEGQARLHAALLAGAYRDSGLVARMSEATDDNTRSLSRALATEAPAFIGLRLGADRGSVHPGLDLGPDVAAAANKLSELRASGQRVPDYLAQAGLFGQELSPESQRLLSLFDEFKRTPSRIAETLHRYVELATAAGDPRQASFTSTESPTKAGLLERAATTWNQAGDFLPFDLSAVAEPVPARLSEREAQLYRQITRALPADAAPAPMRSFKELLRWLSSRRGGEQPEPVGLAAEVENRVQDLVRWTGYKGDLAPVRARVRTELTWNAYVAQQKESGGQPPPPEFYQRYGLAPPTPLASPRHQPLPLPPLHGIDPARVEAAWRQVSARYPATAARISGLRATELEYPDSLGTYVPETREIHLPLGTEPVHPAVLFHELTHAAQHARGVFDRTGVTEEMEELPAHLRSAAAELPAMVADRLASTVSPEHVAAFTPGDSGAVESPSNATAVRETVANTPAASSPAAVEGTQRWLLGSALGDQALAHRVAGSEDRTLARLADPIASVAPSLADAPPELRGYLRQAVDAYATTREAGETGPEIARLGRLLGPDAPEEIHRIASFLSENAEHPESVAQYLHRVAELHQQSGGQTGAAGQLSLAQLLEMAADRDQRQAAGSVIPLESSNPVTKSVVTGKPGEAGFVDLRGPRFGEASPIRRWFTREGKFAAMGDDVAGRVKTLVTEKDFRVKATEKRVVANVRDYGTALRDQMEVLTHADVAPGSPIGPGATIEDVHSYVRAGIMGENDLSAVGPPLQEAAAALRAHLTEQSRAYLQRPDLPASLKAVIGENLDSYFPRTFERITDPKAYAKGIKKDFDAARDAGAPRGQSWKISEAADWAQREHPDWSRGDAEGYAFKLLMDDPQAAYAVARGTQAQKAAMGTESRGNLKARLGLPEELDNLLGLHADPTRSYQIGAMRAARDLATYDLHSKVAQMGSADPARPDGLTPDGQRPIFVDRPTPDLPVRIGGKGPLAEKFTSEQVAAAIRGTQTISAAHTGFMYYYLKVNGAIKTGKIAMNVPMGVARNMLTWPSLLLAGGHWVEAFPAKYAWETIKTLPLAIEANLGTREGGVLRFAKRLAGSLPLANGETVGDHMFPQGQKLADLRAEVLRKTELGVLGQSTSADDLRYYTGMENEPDASSRAGKVIRDLGGIWSGEHDMGKDIVFEAERAGLAKANPDLSPDELDKWARDRMLATTPSRSEVSEGVRAIRAAPGISPFPTFAAERYRNMKNNAMIAWEDLNSTNPQMKVLGAKRAAGLLTALAMAGGGTSWMLQKLWGTVKEDADALREFLPEYLKDHQIAVSDRTGGKIRYADISPLMPLTGVTDPAMALLRGIHQGSTRDGMIDAAQEFARPFLDEEFALKTALDLRGNQQSEGNLFDSATNLARQNPRDTRRRQIYLPGGPPGVVAGQIGKYVWHQDAPAMGLEAERMARATGLLSNTNARGKRYTVADEMAALAGVRFNTIDMNAALTSVGYNLKDALTESKRYFSGERSSSQNDPKTVLDARAAANDRWKNAFEIGLKKVAAARQSGIADYAIRQNLRISGVPPLVIGQLMAGRYSALPLRMPYRQPQDYVGAGMAPAGEEP